MTERPDALFFTPAHQHIDAEMASQLMTECPVGLSLDNWSAVVGIVRGAGKDIIECNEEGDAAAGKHLLRIAQEIDRQTTDFIERTFPDE